LGRSPTTRPLAARPELLPTPLPRPAPAYEKYKCRSAASAASAGKRGVTIAQSRRETDIGFAADSLLEGDGVEPSVPPQNFLAAPSIPQFTFRNINRLPRDRDRWFESISLQQRVGCELDDTITAWRIVERDGPRAGRRCPAALARSRGRAFVEDVFEREDSQRERIVIGFEPAGPLRLAAPLRARIGPTGSWWRDGGSSKRHDPQPRFGRPDPPSERGGRHSASLRGACSWCRHRIRRRCVLGFRIGQFGRVTGEQAFKVSRGVAEIEIARQSGDESTHTVFHTADRGARQAHARRRAKGEVVDVRKIGRRARNSLGEWKASPR
jgi:hypothetical protein